MARILFLSAHLPAPVGTQAGEKVSFSLLDWLARRHDIWLVGMTNQDPRTVSRYVGTLDPACRKTEIFGVDNMCRVLGVASSLRVPLYVGARWSRKLAGRLADLEKKVAFEGVVFDHTQMLQYAPALAGVPRWAVIAHDILSQSVERRAAAATPFSRLLWHLELHRTRSWERAALGACQSIIVLSEKDRRLLLSLNDGLQVHVIPPSIKPPWAESCAWRPKSKSHGIVFWGSMQRTANVDAVRRFVKTTLPLIQRSVPDVVFYVVGARPDKAMVQLGRRRPNVCVTGFVENPMEYFDRAMVAVAPLRIGAGVKIKVLECMRASLPVVASEVAAEGIDASPEDGLLLENGPSAFAERVVELLTDAELARRLGESACRFVCLNYDWERLRPPLENAFPF